MPQLLLLQGGAGHHVCVCVCECSGVVRMCRHLWLYLTDHSGGVLVSCLQPLVLVLARGCGLGGVPKSPRHVQRLLVRRFIGQRFASCYSLPACMAQQGAAELKFFMRCQHVAALDMRAVTIVLLCQCGLLRDQVISATSCDLSCTLYMRFHVLLTVVASRHAAAAKLCWRCVRDCWLLD